MSEVVSVPLARFFAAAWEAFLLGCGLDGGELQDMIEKSGLGAWRSATRADVEAVRKAVLAGYHAGYAAGLQEGIGPRAPPTKPRREVPSDA